MCKLLLTTLIVLTLGDTSGYCAVWVATPELPWSEPTSLISCIQAAANGDSVRLLPGWHFVSVQITKNLTLFCDTPGLATILCPPLLFTMTGCTLNVADVTFESSVRHGPDRMIQVVDACVHFVSTSFTSGTLGGSTVIVQGNSNVTFTECDFRTCPRDCVIRLVDCAQNVVAASCLWPSDDQTFRQRMIWDKNDDPTLGLVIY